MEFAKDFSINKLELTSTTGETIDVRNLLIEFSIFEDIFNNTISGELALNDARNLLMKFPIFGFEKLHIDFNTPDLNRYIADFRVYKVDAIGLTKERQQMYGLHFCSATEITNAQTKVVKSYKGKLISDIADDIQKTYLNSTFNNLNTTKYLHHIVIPQWSPFKAMNWLCSRANAEQFNGANYVYFQTLDGFNFQPVEQLAIQASKQNYKFEPQNIREDSESHPRDVQDDFVNVQSYTFQKRIDALHNITSGMYGSHLITHNLIRKIWRKTDWKYKSTWFDYQHIEQNKAIGGPGYLISQKDDYSPEAKHRLYPSGLGIEDYPNRVESWMQPRLSQMYQLENVRLNITVPGDTTRRAGDVVTFYLPSPEPVTDKQFYDKYYGGNQGTTTGAARYLVTAVRHILKMEEYMTILELIKDEVFSAHP